MMTGKRVRLASAAVATAAVIAAVAAVPGPSRAASRIDGVYRIAWTASDLTAAGTTLRYATDNCGERCTLTMTLRNGRLRIRFSVPPDCLGTYTAAGNAVRMRFTTDCHGLVVAKWSLRKSRLRLRVSTATDPGDAILFGGKPWRRVH